MYTKLRQEIVPGRITPAADLPSEFMPCAAAHIPIALGASVLQMVTFGPVHVLGMHMVRTIHACACIEHSRDLEFLSFCNPMKSTILGHAIVPRDKTVSSDQLEGDSGT